MSEPEYLGDEPMTIADWMLLIVAMALVLAINVAHDFSTYLVVAMFVGTYWWFGLPRGLRRKTILLEPLIERCDSEGALMPESVKARARATVARLEELGFRLCGTLSVRAVEHSLPIFHTLFVKPDSRQRAGLITVAWGRGDNSPTNSFCYCSTEFIDRSTLLTGVGDMKRYFEPFRAHEGSIHLARVESLERLYAIHVASVAHFASCELLHWPEEESVEGRLLANLIRNRIHHIESGYYFFEPVSGVFRLTWKGAIVIAWLSRWPGRMIRARSERHNAARILREIGLSLNERPA